MLIADESAPRKTRGKEKVVLFSLLVLCILFILYCLLGIFQALFLFGTGPQFSQSRFVLNLGIWGGLGIFAFGLAAYIVHRLRKARGK